MRGVFSVFVIFALFHASATMLGSDRGQYGILICALVLGATAAADRWLHPQPRLAAHLGLGLPQTRGVVVAAGVAVTLLVAGVLFAQTNGMTATFYPGWTWLLPGLFAQAGIAEEVLFRGFLFGHLREGRTFLRAASVSMLPFLAVHLVLFATMPWPIALASVALAVIISFPLAYLFELGGGTIWPPALLHFVIQATVKVVGFEDGAATFALFWMAASAMMPLLVFAVPRARQSSGSK
jgi:membrane protease YdiL (CAAX protease family)